MTNIRDLALSLVLLPLALASQGARAETTRCTPITSVPVVISTQGVYCLTQDLATSINTGAAIMVEANNVTIDCNSRKLGGLAAGPSSMANGIMSLGRSNITVRGCNIRGFRNGVLLSTTTAPDNVPSGMLVEDNQLDGNLRTGITILADGSVVRRNLIAMTGTTVPASLAAGIQALYGVDVLDNTVHGVQGDGGQGQFIAGIISIDNERAVIGNNIVRGLSGTETYGVFVTGGSAGTVIGNTVFGQEPMINRNGVVCDAGGTIARDNLLNGFSPEGGVVGCNGSGNTIVQ